MGALHFIGGEKGGVGKSFTARLLAQYFIDHEQVFVGFDSDGSHGTFARFYGDYSTPLYIESFSSLDQIIDTAETQPEANIVVDLAAQTSQKLQKWIVETNLNGIMKELNTPIFYWHVMDDGADSTFLLDKALQDFAGTAVQILVVKNYGCGKSFQASEQSPIYKNAKRAGAKFLLLANLQDQLAQKIDFNSLSFWAAAHNNEMMKIAERHRVKVWLKYCFEQIEKVIQAQPTTIKNTLSHPESYVM